MRSTILRVSILIGLAAGSMNARGSDLGPVYPSDELFHLRARILIAERNERPDALVTELRRLRDLQVQYDAIDSALSTCFRIVNLSGTSDDRIAMAKDWQALSQMTRRSGDLTGAVAAAKRRVLILKTTDDRELESNANLDLLDLLLESNRYSEFKHQSEMTLNALEQMGNMAGQVRVLYRQGEYLTAQGRAADALSLLHSALRNREALANDKEVARIFFALAKANAAVNNWSSAHAAFEDALKLSPNAPDAIPELYGLLARIHEGTGDLEGALHYVRKKSLTKDSLFSATMADRAARMQMLYAMQAKDKNMVDLSEENQAMASHLSTEQIKTRWALLVCAALSVGILLLLLLRLRQSTSIRRTRLKNTVIAGRAKEVEVKSQELERQNLQLSQALMLAKESREELPSRSGLGAGEIQIVDLLVRTQIQHAEDGVLNTGLLALHSRIKTMDLVNRNLVKAEALGAIHLKAHFTALVDASLREREMVDKIDVRLQLVEEEKDLADDLLPLSLLVNELLQISIDHASVSNRTSYITIALRRLAHYQYELLYTDQAGAISGEVLNNGRLGTELVLALAEAMGGSVRLLKSEATSFQFTFEPSATVAIRRAS